MNALEIVHVLSNDAKIHVVINLTHVHQMPFVTLQITLLNVDVQKIYQLEIHFRIVNVHHHQNNAKNVSLILIVPQNWPVSITNAKNHVQQFHHVLIRPIVQSLIVYRCVQWFVNVQISWYQMKMVNVDA